MREFVCLIATGGTVASRIAEDQESGVVPLLDAAALAESAGHIGIPIRTLNYSRMPSGDFTLGDVMSLNQLVQNAVEDAECLGVVIAQGTDTLEEVAFSLCLTASREKPIVVTGAMRHPGSPGADGPANIAAAVHVASSEAAIGRGALVVLNDEVHSALHVRKSHTSSPSAFASDVGLLGWVTEGRVLLCTRPDLPPRIDCPDKTEAKVGIVSTHLDDDGRLLASVSEHYDGIILEALGGGHVPSRVMPTVERLAHQIPVVISSRTRKGAVLERTYGFPGSEIDLLGKGVISAGLLDAAKARMVLALLLSAKTDHKSIVAYFNEFGPGAISVRSEGRPPTTRRLAAAQRSRPLSAR